VKTFVIAAIAAISILSGLTTAKSATLPAHTSFAATHQTSPNTVDFHFTEARRCIIRQKAFEEGEPLIKFVSDCEKPIIMVSCILTLEDGWSCCSNTEYVGQQLVGHGDYHVLSSRDLAESEVDNSFAIGCMPAKVGPALRSLNPISLGSVPDDPCYLAIQKLYQALLRNPQRNPREISKLLGFPMKGSAVSAVQAIDGATTRMEYP